MHVNSRVVTIYSQLQLKSICIDLSTLLFAVTPLILDGFKKIQYQKPSNNVRVLLIFFIKHHTLPVKSQLYVPYGLYSILYLMAHCIITTSCVAFVAGQRKQTLACINIDRDQPFQSSKIIKESCSQWSKEGPLSEDSGTGYSDIA